MDFRICGRVQARLGDAAPQEWRSARVRGLLGALLTSAGKTVLTGTLVDWLWGPDEDPQHPPKSLHNYVSRLRAVLRVMKPPYEVEFVEHGYRIDVDRDRVDYHRARRLLSHGRSALREHDYVHARHLLLESLELAEQPPLLELDTPRAVEFRRSTQNNLVLPVLNTLAESHLGLDEPDAVLALLDELPAEFGLNVTLLKRRLDALWALHRHDEATGHFLDTYRTLRKQGLEEEAADLRAYGQPTSPAVPAPRPPVEDLPHYRCTPQRLPHDRTDLVGRQHLLSTLDEKTDQGRASKLIVLTGTAGIGKTALALRWAHLDRDRYPGGRLYVDLHGFSREPSLDSNTLTRRLLNDFQSPADTLGDSEQQRTRLSRLLAGRHTLLVLDNLADPSQISPLLDLVPDALVLVTSRHHHNHLANDWGAEEIHVPTLTNADATAWLHDTIGTRVGTEREAFESLVSLSAGIPLALRIIGKYAHDRPRTPLTEIVDILRTEHRLLSMGDASDPEHTSLHASFQLSYRNLRGPTQQLFHLLGLHPTAQITLGAATALTDETRATTRTLLDELIQANLLDQEHGRYALHDLLHEFATDTVKTAQTTENQTAARLRLLQ
ncbi:NB-ARC domain-containing protein [Saccharopolyspora sp. SCSIO 74807]|uniref:AfsR/SARP family transcriptional regulator n=1 Tax=Saccharopolyspora sp. SCSIO 74807 TaxID=3118084 RepID=UPI0030CAB038